MRDHHVSADIVGHLQHLDDLPPVGSEVEVSAFSVQHVQSMTFQGEVFAHIKHPDPEQLGWGFALIKFR